MRSLTMPLAALMAAAVILMAADPAWKSKPADQWTEEDAKQFLDRSPWVKQNRATVTRRLTEDQLREAGQMGQPRGIGNEGVDANVGAEKVSPNVLTGPGGDDRGPRSLARPMTVQVRWESALPVRLAEIKTHEVEPPTLEGDGYQIAIYGVPGGDFKGDPKDLGKPLKNQAALKREGKRDVRPVSVEVFQRSSDVVVVYVFPLSAEIGKRDGQVRFEAQIGRIVVAQMFDLNEMQFMGKLEL